MRFHAGDRVIDNRGREVMLECRAYMGRVLVWMAQPVNVTYDSEEGYLAHIARVAALQPGQIVTWRDTEGTYRGVFFQFSNTCQPMVLCCKDGKSACASLTPLCIVFDE